MSVGCELYKKNPSNRSGVDYESKVPMYILKCLHDKKLEFKMATEKSEDLKFDDLFVQVFDPNPLTYLMQLKHVSDVRKRIRFEDLTGPQKNIYSLYRYFPSFLKIKEKGSYKEIWRDVKFVICTTLDFDRDDCQSKNIEVLESNEGNEIFCMGNSKLGKVCRLKIDDESVKEKIFKHISSEVHLSSDKLISLYTEWELSFIFEESVKVRGSERSCTINKRVKRYQERGNKCPDIYKESFSSLIDCFLDKLIFLVTEKEEKIKPLILKELVEVYGYEKGHIVIDRVSTSLEEWMKYRKNGDKGYYLRCNPFHSAVEFISYHENRVAKDHYQREANWHLMKLWSSMNIESSDKDRVIRIMESVFKKLAEFRYLDLIMMFLASYSHDTKGAVSCTLPNVLVECIKDIRIDIIINHFSLDIKDDIDRYFEMIENMFSNLFLRLLYYNNGLPCREGDVSCEKLFLDIFRSPYPSHLMFPTYLPYYIRNACELPDGEQPSPQMHAFRSTRLYQYFKKIILPDALCYLHSLGLDFFKRS